MSLACILPPGLLARVVRNADGAARDIALSTLLLDASMRTVRLQTRPVRATLLPRSDSLQRGIYTAAGAETQPGELVRSEGAAATGDPAADEAYDGLGATWTLLHDAYGRSSIDDEGLPLIATVHYGQAYDNAFWDGTQMVFGDGDGQLFRRFHGRGRRDRPRAGPRHDAGRGRAGLLRPERGRSTSRSPTSSGRWSSSMRSARAPSRPTG